MVATVPTGQSSMLSAIITTLESERSLVPTLAALIPGAAAGLMNFGLWLIAGHTMMKESAARAFLPLKLFAAIGMVWALQRWVPGAPAFVGFAVPFVAILVRTLFRLPSFVRAR